MWLVMVMVIRLVMVMWFGGGDCVGGGDGDQVGGGDCV